MSQNRTLKDQFMLRFPDGMREALKIEAARNHRSLNSEILHRLESTMQAILEEEEKRQEDT
ncbi:MAG: Arc family DNA-binding protein [Rhodobacteraceae bacterium]|nr:Arc family DNA-binding protein [Paracoccaceae bacterium]MBR9823033.1 Arc family DNA-binding protein [Paracoccaceae bacterium]